MKRSCDYPMLPFEDAWRRIAAALAPLPPALRLLWRPCVEVRLAETLRHDPDRTEFQRAIVEPGPEGFTAHSTGGQGSGRLKSLVGANALLILPIGMGDFPAGSRVMAFLINQPEVREDLPIFHPCKNRNPFWQRTVHHDITSSAFGSTTRESQFFPAQ